MHSDRLSGIEIERAVLRLRLAAAALALTLVLLGGGAPVAVPVGLLVYVVVALAVRALAPRLASRELTLASIGFDIAAIGGLVAALPLDRPAWMLFLFPLGIGAMRYGALGAAAVAALAVLLVDVTIALRLREAEAIQLWPLQLLIAAALVVAELARLRERDDLDEDVLRRRAAALADLSGAVASTYVLRAATDHLSRVRGVGAAWAWVQRDGDVGIEHERGLLPAWLRAETRGPADLPERGHAAPLLSQAPPPGPEAGPAGPEQPARGPSTSAAAVGRVIGLHDDPRMAVGMVVEEGAADAERRDSLVLDIAEAASRALAATVDRERAERAVGELRVSLEQVRGLLRAKEEAVATAVHELRTPLTSVGGYAQIMSRHLETLQRQVGQLTRLISDLQPMASPATELTIAPTDLRELVRGAVARARVLADAEVRFDGPPQPLVVTVDAPRIGQVIDNLLGNAVKYSAPPAEVEVSLRLEGEGIVLTVTDQGRGIAPDDLPHLFQRGYRSAGAADVRGGGIGLALVREIVEGHGGRVGASSAGQGRGSTFWVVLPREGLPSPRPDDTEAAGNGEAQVVRQAQAGPSEPAGMEQQQDPATR